MHLIRIFNKVNDTFAYPYPKIPCLESPSPKGY